MATIDITTAATSELVAFFNAHTGGNPVKKFADRKTAERRVQALLDELAAEESKEQPVVGEFTHCPHCHIHLNNGHQTYDNLSADGDKIAKTMAHHYMCLGCGATFGPEVVRYTRVRGTTPVVERPAMSASLKLDRQIRNIASGIVYKNACQVWKAGLISSSQCDRLSAQLYGAAKRGDRALEVTVNGHAFTLAVK